MVVSCTGLDERAQNKLFLKVQKLQGSMLVRDKMTAGMYDTRTTLLVVGSNIRRTDKLLCAIAAGVPIVRADYVNGSRMAGYWFDIEYYDVGSEREQNTEGAVKDRFTKCFFLFFILIFDRIFIPPLERRQAKKKEGGVFKGWSVVVLLEDARQKEVYRRMLELGGAVVHRWTLTHLLDGQAKVSPQFKGLTHVIAQPGMLLQEHFRHFLAVNEQSQGGHSVVTRIYPGDFLSQRELPQISNYDLRNPEMWPLTEEMWTVRQLQLVGGSSWQRLVSSQRVPFNQDGLRSQQEQVNQGANTGDLSRSTFRKDALVPLRTPDSPESEDSGKNYKRRRLVEDKDSDEEVVVLSVTKASTILSKPSVSVIARLRAKAAEFKRK